jgi:hypothetical protein
MTAVNVLQCRSCLLV